MPCSPQPSRPWLDRLPPLTHEEVEALELDLAAPVPSRAAWSVQQMLFTDLEDKFVMIPDVHKIDIKAMDTRTLRPGENQGWSDSSASQEQHVAGPAMAAPAIGTDVSPCRWSFRRLAE